MTHVPYANPIRFPLERQAGESVGRRVARYIEQTILNNRPPDDCAAIVVEPVQGEGGYVVPDADFLPKLVPPETPGIARVVAIANQKGGVGKSTTAVSLGASLADLGYRVLVVDLDPQGNASTGMGIRHEAREITVYDVIVSEASVKDAIVQTPVKHLSALPSTIDLAGANNLSS